MNIQTLIDCMTLKGCGPLAVSLPNGASLPVNWLIVAAGAVGFIIGAVRIAGWAAAVLLGGGAAIMGAPVVGGWLTAAGWGTTLADDPWLAAVLAGAIAGFAVLVVSEIARRALKLTGLGLVDRGVGAMLCLGVAGVSTPLWTWLLLAYKVLPGYVHP